MARDRSGYVFQDKKGNWFARTTFTDERGKRRNLKRKAKDKTEAKQILKTLLRQLEDEGQKSFDVANLRFNDLANYYDEKFLIEAQFVDGKKIAGLRDVGRAKGFLVHFREYFGKNDCVKLPTATFTIIAAND